MYYKAPTSAYERSKMYQNNIELMYSYDGMTRKEFAQKCGISANAVFKAEHGMHIGVNTRRKIVETLGSIPGNVFHYWEQKFAKPYLTFNEALEYRMMTRDMLAKRMEFTPNYICIATRSKHTSDHFWQKIALVLDLEYDTKKKRFRHKL